MIGTWHNNRISEKLHKEYDRNFSICDIDGAVRCHYNIDGQIKTRFIIYESKNEYEKDINPPQLKTLQKMNEAIDWNMFDEYSGIYILKIIDIDDKILWISLYNQIIRETSFKELADIFSCADKRNLP